MSKNKFIKKLLIAGLCAVSATAMIGATACKDNKPNEEPDPTGHVHNYATGDDWSSDANGHWYRCKNAGHTDAYDVKPHGVADQNGQCPTCHYQLVTDPGPGPGPGPSVTHATEKYTVDASSLSSLSNGDAVGTGTGITAVGALAVDANTKTVMYNGTDKEITKRLKLSGTMKATENALKFEIANDNSVIVIHAYSGSSTSTDNSHIRSLAIRDENFEEIDGQDAQCIGDGNHMGTAIFEVNAGTYYIGSTNKGINIYHIAIWEGGALNETDISTVPEATATCTTPGNIEYTKTSFGRYKNGAGTFVSEHELYSDALGHDWELDDQENWTLPGKDGETYTEGSVKVLCNNNHEHDYVYTLPVLTNPDYTKTTQGQEAGKALYGWAIPGTGKTATFVAEDVAAAEVTWTPVYTNDFTSGTVGSDNTVAAVNGAKIYAVDQDSDASNTYTAEIADGAYHANGAKAYITLENTITSGSVKISGSMKCASANGSWTYFQILTADGTEFVALRTTKSGSDLTQKVRVDGTEKGTAVAIDTNASFDYEIIIDLDNKTVTFKIGETTLVKNEVFTKGVDLSSIMLNCNSGRNAYINSITIEVPEA